MLFVTLLYQHQMQSCEQSRKLRVSEAMAGSSIGRADFLNRVRGILEPRPDVNRSIKWKSVVHVTYAIDFRQRTSECRCSLFFFVVGMTSRAFSRGKERELQRARTHHVIKIELQPPLRYRLLNALAVGRIAGRAGAPLALVDEAADLIRRTSRVLLAGAEAVHSGLTGNSLFAREPSAVAT